MESSPVLFGPVGPEIIVIIAILILLFGAQRIPKIANSVGRSLGSFKKGRKEIEAELEQAENDLSEAKTETKHKIDEAVSDVEQTMKD